MAMRNQESGDTVLSPPVPYDVISVDVLSQISVNYFYYIDNPLQKIAK